MGGVEDLRDLLSLWDHDASPLGSGAIRKGIGGLRLRREDVADWIAFSEAAYQRILIHQGIGFEALLLCWRSGQRSPIHDHAGSTCGVRIIAGRATETIFARSPCGRLVPARSRSLDAGSVCVSHDADIHQMGNLALPGQDLITLHIYSPPLTAMRVYSIGETTLADLDNLAALKPHDLTLRIRLDGAHSFPSSSTPKRVSKLTP
jgi:cysteine dioxygenase